jgi:integrase
LQAPRHLSTATVDALLDAPDQQTPLGRRDYALLLFLARTGARVSEAIGVDAADLRLDRPTVGRGRRRVQDHHADGALSRREQPGRFSRNPTFSRLGIYRL